MSVQGKYVIIVLLIASASIVFGAEVFFFGNTVISDSIIDSVFSNNDISNGTESVLLLYAENGCPFCEIRFDSIIQKGDKYIYYAEVNENGFYRMKSAVSKGTLSEKFINRLVKLNGKPFSKSSISKELSKLKRFDYADCSRIEEFSPSVINDSEVVIEVSIDQIRQSYVSGVLASDFDTLKITGFLDLSLINVFNDGAEYAMYFSKLSKYSSELALTGKAPYIFSSPLGLSGEASYAAADTLSAYLATGMSIFTYAGNMTIYAGGGREWTFYPGMSDSNDSYYYLSSKAEYAVAAGRKFHIQAKKAFGRDRYSRLNGEGILSPQLWKIGIECKAGFGYLFADNIKPQMLVPLGGTNSIRGYPENFVYSSDNIFAGISPGFKISKYITAGLFCEGAFYSTGGETLFEKNLLSYGAYLSMLAGRTKLDISYALKRGASPYDGRIHISTKYIF